jgi:uncharacterized membrane protein YoaK (UPF0700 family)
MLSKPIPAWIYVAAAALTGCAGCVNAIGFLGVHHQALSHMSGTGTIFSTELSLGRIADAGHALRVMGFFFLGCVLSGMIIRQSTLQLGRRYGVALAVESALLFGATYFLRSGSNAGDFLAAMACGLQNAMATSYSGAIIRTTHITGIVTDLGIAIGLLLRREEVSLRRIGLFLTLLAGFLLGGVVGGLAYQRFGFDALLLPATGTGLTGLAYAIYRHYRRPHRGPAG